MAEERERTWTIRRDKDFTKAVEEKETYATPFLFENEPIGELRIWLNEHAREETRVC